MRFLLVLVALSLCGCTSQFALGPAAWSAANAPVIPGYHPVPLGNGGFIEEPDAPAGPPPPAPIETVITGLEQAQKVRTLARQLAR